MSSICRVCNNKVGDNKPYVTLLEDDYVAEGRLKLVFGQDEYEIFTTETDYIHPECLIALIKNAYNVATRKDELI